MAPVTNRTDVAAGAATAAGVLQTLLILDDTVTSGTLGNRASAYVTTALGRRNIERASQSTGFNLEYGTALNLPTEVPFYRGRPILVSSGLVNDGGLNTAPVYAVDFTYVFLVATTGDADGYCIQSEPLGLQDTGSKGSLQWFHGACVVRHPGALVRSTITTTLSA